MCLTRLHTSRNQGQTRITSDAAASVAMGPALGSVDLVLARRVYIPGLGHI